MGDNVIEQTPERPSPRTPKERIEGLLHRSPSGPEFTQSTITYTREAIEASVARFEEVLTRDYPEAATDISRRLRKPIEGYQALPSTDFATANDKTVLKSPKGRNVALNPTLEAIYRANPDLGIFHYAIALYLPLDQRFAKNYFPGFNLRFRRLVEIGNLSFDAPITEIIAVSYITQVAKNFAVDEARELLKKASLFGGIASLDKIDPYLETVVARIRKIRRDQEFIAAGIATINQIAQEANLDQNQVGLLQDLAFIKSAEFDKPEEFRQVFGPLVMLVVEGKWQEAFEHRDFLLKYFSNSFPGWHARRFYEETGAITFESFKQLAQAVIQGKAVIDDSEVPSEYKKVFGEIFPKKLERAQIQREIEIIKQSVGLSKAIIRGLGYRQLPDIKLPFLGTGVKGISFREISSVEEQDNTQVFWYPTSEEISRRDKSGSFIATMRNHANFGRLLYQFMLEQTKQPERAEAIKEVFLHAYEREKQRNPRMQFTLAEYLRALVNRANLRFEVTSEDPVGKFIEDLSR